MSQLPVNQINKPVSLTSNWSMEILPSNFPLLPKIPDFVKEIYITMIPGGNWNDTVNIAQKVQNKGKQAIPHIAARNLKGIEELEKCLSGLKESKIQKVLLISGGQSKPEGNFSCVMDMLKTDLFTKYGINSIDFAGHPEGNPDDPYSESSLVDKLRWSQEKSIQSRIITQWCFDSDNANQWINDLRKKGISNPIHIGIPGPSTLKTLLRFAKVCGVKASTSVLRKQGINLSKLLFLNKPDNIVTQLQGYDQLHLYPFGGIEKSSEWLIDWKNPDKKK